MPIYIPELVILIAALGLLLMEVFLPQKQKKSIAYIGSFVLALSFMLTFFASEQSGLGGYLGDSISLFFRRFFILSTFITIIMSVDYEKVFTKFSANFLIKNGSRVRIGVGEFYILPLFACVGLMWLISAGDIISIFVALELVTICFYVMVAYMKYSAGSIESGVKYLILGAFSTCLLVFGIAWLYGCTGEVDFFAISEKIASNEILLGDKSLLFAFVLIICALAFKLGVFPFHVWVPDVYQGAPTPVTAFLSSASKAAGFVILLKFIKPFMENEVTQKPVTIILLIMACMTMVVGNFSAIHQTNFKRLLAYSSIAHSGYLLLASCCVLSETNPNSYKVIGFYFLGYLLMNSISFYSLTLMHVQIYGEDISSFNGLFRRNSFLAGALLISTASLAGVPFTIGFLGKFFVLNLALENGINSIGYYIGVAFALIGFAIGFYYYFKIIAAIFWEEVADDRKVSISPITVIVLALLTFFTILFGIYPEPILRILG